MNKLNIKVILGSTRPNRFGEQPAQWIHQMAKKVDEFEVELLDLRDYPMPFFNESVSPSRDEFTHSDETSKRWEEKIAEADGFIIVSPEYNHGTSAVLKNALDYTYYPWNKKPVAFVSYGGLGGARAVEQLRLNAVELQMAPLRSAVHIIQPWNKLDENGKLKTDRYNDSALAMFKQLKWWGYALKNSR